MQESQNSARNDYKWSTPASSRVQWTKSTPYTTLTTVIPFLMVVNLWECNIAWYSTLINCNVFRFVTQSFGFCSLILIDTDLPWRLLLRGQPLFTWKEPPTICDGSVFIEYPPVKNSAPLQSKRKNIDFIIEFKLNFTPPPSMARWIELPPPLCGEKRTCCLFLK